MHKYKNNNSTNGLSLIELAVVIVIIGLILAAVSTGKDLLHQSKVKTVIAEMGDYVAGVEAFRTKYYYRPGDMPTALADDYFSAVHANADGNGSIDVDEEKNLAWMQLSEAEMIKPSFPDSNATDTTAIPGANRPASKMDGAGWTLFDSLVINPGTGNRYYYHILRIGGAGVGLDLPTPVLTVDDHLYIDNKVDKPNSPADGIYVVGEANCSTGTAPHRYITNDVDRKCTGNYVEVSNPTGCTPGVDC